MDLDELRVLIAVADTGSVLAASEHLRITRSTLRRRLEALEARVGAPLLYRGPTGAELTESGRVVLGHARRILDESAALLVAAREVGDAASGTLRVVAPVGLPPIVVTLIYQSLRERLPGLRIQVHYSEDTAATLVDDVDLLLHFGPRLTTGAWVTRVLHPVHEVLLASPAYLERAGLPTHPEELAGHDLLFWRGPCSDGPALPLRSGGLLPVSPLLESSDAYTLRLLARAGLGLAWLPEGRVPDPEEEPGALVPVLPELIGRECPLRMAVPEALAHAPRIQRLLALIGEHLQENG